jgi:phage-related minor tail protein
MTHPDLLNRLVSDLDHLTKATVAARQTAELRRRLADEADAELDRHRQALRHAEKALLDHIEGDMRT